MNNQLIGPVDLFKYAWGQYKAHWKVLTTILVLPYALFTIGPALMSTLNLPLVFLGFLVSVAGAVLMLAASTGLVKTIHDVDSNSGAQISVKAQYSFGFSLFWSVVLISIIRTLVFFGSGVLFIIPAIIIMVYASFYTYTLIIDGKKGFSALTESFALVRGRWWKTLGRVVFIGLVAIVITLITAGLRFLLASIFGYHMGSSIDVGVAMLLQIVFVLFYVPISIAYLYKFYQALKQTTLPDAPVKTFKRWLVAFLVIGIIIIPSLFVSVFLVSLNSARKAAEVASTIK